jgi:diaminopimelate decarboxylase
VGDFAILKGTGAYCSAMSLKNYNSFPEAAEVMLVSSTSAEGDHLVDGPSTSDAISHVKAVIIRKRQDFEEIMKNEVEVIKN